MTEPDLPHRRCSCSRTRQCAMHRDQMRALTRRPQQQFRQERQDQALAEGIEELRRKYGGER